MKCHISKKISQEQLTVWKKGKKPYGKGGLYKEKESTSIDAAKFFAQDIQRNVRVQLDTILRGHLQSRSTLAHTHMKARYIIRYISCIRTATNPEYVSPTITI